MKRGGIIYCSMVLFVSVLIISICIPEKVYSWGKSDWNLGDQNSGHLFITDRAIEYLYEYLNEHEPGMLVWQEYFDDHLTDIKYGLYWADYPFNGELGLLCYWWPFEDDTKSSCDGSHHHSNYECIYCPIITDIISMCAFQPMFSVLGAPNEGWSYAQNLYDIGVQFWPGDVVPDFTDTDTFKYIEQGARAHDLFFSRDYLGPMVLGAVPFAANAWYQITYGEEYDFDYDPLNPPDWAVEHAYTWPHWTDGTEDKAVSAKYLGWALHLVQDLTNPDHAKSWTGPTHVAFEDKADELIENNNFYYLPVAPDGQYYYEWMNIPGAYFDVHPDFFNLDWTIQQYALRGVYGTIPYDWDYYNSLDKDSYLEIHLDLGIKITAGVLYKFIHEMSAVECNATPGNPSSEICDGLDNDCDGFIDEGSAGDVLTQSTVCGVGQCAGNVGFETCMLGEWINNTCNPIEGASPEICDYVDNDCDGLTDEGFPDLDDSCSEGIGECLDNGTIVCATDGSETVCDAVPGEPTEEICDTLDNDCNGLTDDSDYDGDGVVVCDDLCLEEDATGFDADEDGCIDSTEGLNDEVNALVTVEAIDIKTAEKLIHKIEAALAKLDKDNVCGAIGSLEGLIIQINDKREKSIPNLTANMLVSYVENIIAQLEASLPPGETC